MTATNSWFHEHDLTPEEQEELRSRWERMSPRGASKTPRMKHTDQNEADSDTTGQNDHVSGDPNDEESLSSSSEYEEVEETEIVEEEIGDDYNIEDDVIPVATEGFNKLLLLQHQQQIPQSSQNEGENDDIDYESNDENEEEEEEERDDDNDEEQEEIVGDSENDHSSEGEIELEVDNISITTTPSSSLIMSPILPPSNSFSTAVVESRVKQHQIIREAENASSRRSKPARVSFNKKCETKSFLSSSEINPNWSAKSQCLLVNTPSLISSFRKVGIISTEEGNEEHQQQMLKPNHEKLSLQVKPKNLSLIINNERILESISKHAVVNFKGWRSSFVTSTASATTIAPVTTFSPSSSHDDDQCRDIDRYNNLVAVVKSMLAANVNRGAVSTLLQALQFIDYLFTRRINQLTKIVDEGEGDNQMSQFSASYLALSSSASSGEWFEKIKTMNHKKIARAQKNSARTGPRKLMSSSTSASSTGVGADAGHDAADMISYLVENNEMEVSTPEVVVKPIYGANYSPTAVSLPTPFKPSTKSVPSTISRENRKVVVEKSQSVVPAKSTSNSSSITGDGGSTTTNTTKRKNAPSKSTSLKKSSSPPTAAVVVNPAAVLKQTKTTLDGTYWGPPTFSEDGRRARRNNSTSDAAADSTKVTTADSSAITKSSKKKTVPTPTNKRPKKTSSKKKVPVQDETDEEEEEEQEQKQQQEKRVRKKHAKKHDKVLEEEDEEIEQEKSEEMEIDQDDSTTVVEDEGNDDVPVMQSRVDTLFETLISSSRDSHHHSNIHSNSSSTASPSSTKGGVLSRQAVDSYVATSKRRSVGITPDSPQSVVSVSNTLTSTSSVPLSRQKSGSDNFRSRLQQQRQQSLPTDRSESSGSSVVATTANAPSVAASSFASASKSSSSHDSFLQDARSNAPRFGSFVQNAPSSSSSSSATKSKPVAISSRRKKNKTSTTAASTTTTLAPSSFTTLIDVSFDEQLQQNESEISSSSSLHADGLFDEQQEEDGARSTKKRSRQSSSPSNGMDDYSNDSVLMSGESQRIASSSSVHLGLVQQQIVASMNDIDKLIESMENDKSSLSDDCIELTRKINARIQTHQTQQEKTLFMIRSQQTLVKSLQEQLNRLTSHALSLPPPSSS